MSKYINYFLYSIIKNHNCQIEYFVDYIHILEPKENNSNLGYDELLAKLNELQESNILENNSSKLANFKLNKNLKEDELTFSSSSLNLISCFLDFIGYNYLIPNFNHETYSYIFVLFDFYIYAGINMFISSGVIENIEYGTIMIKNEHYDQIEVLSEEAQYYGKYLNLRKFLFNTTKKISEKIFSKVNLNLKSLLPKLSSDIYVDSTNLYSCLIEKIVFYESCITLYKFIKRIFSLSLQKKYQTQMNFYKILLEELKGFIYYPILPNILNLKSYLSILTNQNWNLAEHEATTSFNDASEFVYSIIDEVFEKYNNLTLLSSDSLTKISKLRFFHIILVYLIDELSYAISEIPICSSVGRSVLLKDMKYLKTNFEDIIKDKKQIQSDLLFNQIISYINAWYYDEKDLALYMKKNHIQLKLITGILTSGLSFSKLPNENKRLIKNKIKDIAIEEIYRINEQLVK